MEDYKEKYKNALSHAKQAIDNIPDKALAKWLQCIFPELNEYEEERIRNFISNELACIRATDEKGSDRYEELTNAIAWLNELGKQEHLKKHAETELPKGEDYGINGLWQAIQILEQTLGQVDGYQSDDGILEHECAIEAVKRIYKLCPIPWSKEDDEMFDNVIQTEKDCIDYCDVDDVGTKARFCYEKEIKWLETIKKRMKGETK